MKLTNLFEYYEELLLEGQYDKMFSKEWIAVVAVYDSTFNHLEVKAHIKWAKQILKKQDRIVWYLRWLKIRYTNVAITGMKRQTLDQTFRVFKALGIERGNRVGHELQSFAMEELYKIRIKFERDLKKINKRSPVDTRTVGNAMNMANTLMDNLAHYLALGIHDIDNYTFGWEWPHDLFVKFEEFEDEWKDKTKRLVRHLSDQKSFIKVGKYEWFDLGRASCGEEGQAMGHCGNGNQTDPNTTIFSLREHIEDFWWKPHATFIYNKQDKSLGEMKGVYNKKPKPETHKAIIKLLMDKRIKSIEGGGYLPKNNFSISDLSDTDRNKLIKHNPHIIETVTRGLYNRYKLFRDFIKDNVKGQDLGLLDFIHTIIEDPRGNGVKETAYREDDIKDLDIKDFNIYMKYHDGQLTFTDEIAIKYSMETIPK